MLRSLTSGEVIDRHWTRFSFPPIWHYDVLRGLDYLRSAGVKPDERVAEAVELVEERRHQNGRWPLGALHPDRVRLPRRHGSRRRQGQPLEHAARAARAGLVWDLSVRAINRNVRPWCPSQRTYQERP